MQIEKLHARYQTHMTTYVCLNILCNNAHTCCICMSNCMSHVTMTLVNILLLFDPNMLFKINQNIISILTCELKPNVR